MPPRTRNRIATLNVRPDAGAHLDTTTIPRSVILSEAKGLAIAWKFRLQPVERFFPVRGLRASAEVRRCAPSAGPADSGMDIHAVTRQYPGMFDRQWSQLAAVDLQAATPIFRNWDTRVPAPPLPAGTVHLWLVNLDPPAGADDAGAQVLSGAERDRAARFRFPIDRQRFIVRRTLLRQLAAGYVNQPAASLEFTTTAAGKPQLATPARSGILQFNLSVAANRALCGFAWNTALGVDLARWRAPFDWREIVTSFFQPAEAAHIRQLPPPDQERVFYKLWTLKEALVKARGGGLSDPLARADFSPLLRNAREPVVDAAGTRWRWASWEPTDRWAAAVALEQ